MEGPEEQDHYSVLDIAFGATSREIRSAARKLHLRYHPDKGGSSEQFCKVRLAEETLMDKEQRCEFDKKYPSVQQAWQMYRRAEELRRQHNEEVARFKREEARRREQESIRRAQEEQQRTAQERLRKWYEEEERKKKLEADRKRAEEEDERLRADRLRQSLLEQAAMARTEAVIERRRNEVKEQANRRMKQQFADDQLQEQRNTWSQFYLRGHRISNPSMETQQSKGPERVCKHNLWVKGKGKGTCVACARVNYKTLMECPDCLQVRCQTCTK